jgi:hypothetical protein
MRLEQFLSHHIVKAAQIVVLTADEPDSLQSVARSAAKSGMLASLTVHFDIIDVLYARQSCRNRHQLIQGNRANPLGQFFVCTGLLKGSGTVNNE